MAQHFQKIPGFKVVAKCRNCGKKLVTKTETIYCDECLQRLRDYRYKNQ